MRQNSKLFSRRLGVLMAALSMPLILGGCLSVLPEPEAPNALYEVQARELPNLSLSANLIIREPESVRVFAGESIVAQGTDGGLKLVPGVEWAGPSTQILQLALMDTFNSGNGAGIAVTPSSGSRAPYELDWRITDLSLRGSSAVCELQLILLDGRTRNPIGKFAVRETVNAGSTDGPLRGGGPLVRRLKRRLQAQLPK